MYNSVCTPFPLLLVETEPAHYSSAFPPNTFPSIPFSQTSSKKENTTLPLLLPVERKPQHYSSAFPPNAFPSIPFSQTSSKKENTTPHFYYVLNLISSSDDKSTENKKRQKDHDDPLPHAQKKIKKMLRKNPSAEQNSNLETHELKPTLSYHNPLPTNNLEGYFSPCSASSLSQFEISSTKTMGENTPLNSKASSLHDNDSSCSSFFDSLLNSPENFNSFSQSNLPTSSSLSVNSDNYFFNTDNLSARESHSKKIKENYPKEVCLLHAGIEAWDNCLFLQHSTEQKKYSCMKNLANLFKIITNEKRRCPFPECIFSGSQKNLLTAHINNIHIKFEISTCLNCRKGFKNNKGFARHAKTCTPSKFN